jgi:hypothetical protein
VTAELGEQTAEMRMGGNEARLGGQCAPEQVQRRIVIAATLDDLRKIAERQRVLRPGRQTGPVKPLRIIEPAGLVMSDRTLQIAFQFVCDHSQGPSSAAGRSAGASNWALRAISTCSMTSTQSPRWR